MRFRLRKRKQLLYQCVICKKATDSRGIKVDPISLQRKYVGVCSRSACYMTLSRRNQDARLRRTKNDWQTETLKDQYPGKVRNTIRDFVLSDDEFQSVEPTSSTLQGSILTLGLEGKVYAEERSRESIIRRVINNESSEQG